jgi:hypothetical protein
MFHQNFGWIPNETIDEDSKFTFMLCDSEFRINEISESAPEICGLTLEMLEEFKSN